MTGAPQWQDEVARGLDAAIADYRRDNPGSARYRETAADVLPGGGTRSSYHFAPFPLVLACGSGDRVSDVDGRTRLDLNANFGVSVHGHGFAPIVEAVRAQSERGFCFAAPNPLEAELARRICERVPSIELLRFTSSGTEAVMAALSVARAFTGRRRVAKLHGGYHGSSDFGTANGPGSAPDLGSNSARAAAVPADILPLSVDEPDRLVASLREAGDDLAAVVVEPVQGAAGLIQVPPELLARIRAVTQELGILLIFDEVMMFRMHRGGVQSMLGLRPDLTVLGKLIGGGLPVGAFGGRADIMGLFDPFREGAIRLAGTYNGNPMTMAAGIACLDALEEADFTRMDHLAQALAGAGNAVLARRAVPASIVAAGGFFCLHALPRPARSHAQLLQQDQALHRLLHLGLINEGVLVTPTGMGVVSTRTGPAEVDEFAAALERVLARYLRPAQA